MIVDKEYLDFWLFVRQKKLFEHITLGSGELWFEILGHFTENDWSINQEDNQQINR